MRITFIKTGKRIKPKEKKKLENKEKINNIEKIDSESDKIKKSNKIQSKANFFKSDLFNNVFRKNQIVLLTLALMLVTAGYMNYNNKLNEDEIPLAEIGDAQLVSANVVETAENNEIIQSTTSNANINNTDNSNKIESDSINNNIIESSENLDNYFEQTRLERQTMYSQMLEAYNKILENEKIPSDQKSIASNEIKNINDRINAISIIENLIKTKGFEDVIILINDNNINVVVKQENNLNDEQVAQILNIVSRELKAEIEDIHITIHK